MENSPFQLVYCWTKNDENINWKTRNPPGKKQFADGETMEKKTPTNFPMKSPSPRCFRGLVTDEPNPSKEGICGLGQEGALNKS